MKIFYLLLLLVINYCYCTQSPSNTHKPSYLPSSHPTSVPSARPTASPSVSFDPTPCPSSRPTGFPTGQPSSKPSRQPTSQPTRQPTGQPTSRPSRPTISPTPKPTVRPTIKPSSSPTVNPTPRPTTKQPTARPTIYYSPTRRPTGEPTGQPTSQPSTQPSSKPTHKPSQPTHIPTHRPSSYRPSPKPTNIPSRSPQDPTFSPSSKPTAIPTSRPTTKPTCQPSPKPIANPTNVPTYSPATTNRPTGQPTGQPSSLPSAQPSARPTVQPTVSKHPTSSPTGRPSIRPTGQPSRQPTDRPTSQPTSSPSQPTGQPTSQPTRQPSSQPTRQPTGQPTSRPTETYKSPTPKPTASPTYTVPPTSQPTSQPTRCPSSQPSSKPTSSPTVTPPPTGHPTALPSGQPTTQPTTIWGSTYSPTQEYQLYNISGSVSFDPDDKAPCEEVEIRLSFTFHRNISSGTSIHIQTPGLTSGPCFHPSNGNDIVDVMVYNATAFDVKFFEGSYADEYTTSYFKIVILDPPTLSIGYEYVLLIDRANGLKRTCSNNSSWIVQYYRTNRLIVPVGHLNVYTTSRLHCYLYDSSISFAPSFPQIPTGINITIYPAFTFDGSISFIIYLPQFTNQIENYPISNLGTNNTRSEGIVRYIQSNATLYQLSYNTNYSWHGTFHGSNYTLNDSYIKLTPLGSQSTVTTLWIYIPSYPNRIIPLCGHPADYSGYKIKTESIDGSYYINDTTITSSSAAGPGCSKLNDCNGNGICDFCSMTCDCFNGFGSPSDQLVAITNDFSIDCSSRTCPIGPAYGILPTFSSATRSASSHRLVECSASGKCNRKTGQCNCFSGFTGDACEKRSCPSFSGRQCSGRGQCLSMDQLAFESTALPLRNTSKKISYSFRSSDDYIAWDANLSRECLCDSSWTVGLKSNQTQLGEFFGSACQYRRCPSGDDPETLTDETNCYGISQTSGDVGEVGNLCHIDCSNRGVCDYSTGICKCFLGYQGSNCNTIQKYKGHYYTDEIVYSNRVG